MALEIIWSENAKDDLHRIYMFIKKEWTVRIADAFLNLCIEQTLLLSDVPYIGTRSPGKDNIRKILLTSHNYLYYEIENTSIIILAIIDTRSNPSSNPFN